MTFTFIKFTTFTKFTILTKYLQIFKFTKVKFVNNKVNKWFLVEYGKPIKIHTASCNETNLDPTAALAKLWKTWRELQVSGSFAAAFAMVCIKFAKGSLFKQYVAQYCVAL